MIGKTIKYMRNKKGIKQGELAKILNVERTTLSGYETERRKVDFETVQKIAKVCNYQLFFEGNNEKFKCEDVERKDI